MIEAFDDGSKSEELLQIVAEELPVLVLGPGCFRVGFDNPKDDNWRQVENRVADVLALLDDSERAYLQAFFVSKLSDEHRTDVDYLERLQARLDKHARFPLDDDETAHDPFVSFVPWRSLLAKYILLAYRDASCCLGLMIGQGIHPVLQWQEAAIPADVINRWVAGDGPNQPELSAREHFKASSLAITAAADTARAMLALERGQKPIAKQVTALDTLQHVADQSSRRASELKSVLEGPLKILLPSSIASKLDVLARLCFSPEADEPLRGGHVEWLGDLLWHVLAADAAVQHSQADLAFHVALADPAAPPRSDELKRPAFGDRPIPEIVVTRLTRRSQPDDAAQALERGQFLESMARCLMAQHGLVASRSHSRAGGEAGEEAASGVALAGVSTHEKLSLALVGDYGDLFERAMFNLLDDDGMFHVCLPVWLDWKNRKSIDWVLLDVTRRGGSAKGTWRWLADAEDASGPIVIKMSGCDRSPLRLPLLHGQVSQTDLARGTYGSKRLKGKVQPALLYDDFDRLTAMQVFDELLDPKDSGGLADSLSTPGKGLTWPDRSWVIMGQRFGDWVPRLRLFRQMWAGVNVRPETQGSYWAIDRSFDWPERTLLPSLGISMVAGDLRRVSDALSDEGFKDLRSTPIGDEFVEHFTKQKNRG